LQPRAQQPQAEATLKIVGSNTFGRNDKLSSEQTFNMMISDDWLVQTPGYKKVIEEPGRITGRGIFASRRGNFMIAVIDNVVYKISGPTNNLTSQQIFTIDTFFGDVSIDENLGGQIGICDGQAIWIYNWLTSTATKATLPINTQTGISIVPGFITFHDGYFIVPDKSSSFWYLSAQNNGLSWLWGAGGQPVAGSIQTKPDNAVAVLRAPGRGNMILVFGQNVTEMWYDNGAQLFPYQRNNSVSIDYGCLSSTTIAAMDEYIAWLGSNEKSGPVIMVSSGTEFTRLSTDGIDFKLADIVNPGKSYAFFFRIDGHVFYQLTFYDTRDNLTLLYDFNTQKFFYLTDENMNYHISESVAFFNNTYYFVSLNDGDVYELSSEYFTYDYRSPGSTNGIEEYEIPRMRITNDFRLPDTSRFIGNSLTFPFDMGNDERYPISELEYPTSEDGFVIEQEGIPGFLGAWATTEVTAPSYVPRIDMAISKDSGYTYGSFVTKQLNPLGKRKNRVVFWRMGLVNDLTVQFRFWSKSSVTVGDGVFQSRVQGDGQ
jgi:hypothetical protein